MKLLGLDIQPTTANVVVLKKRPSAYCVMCAESIQLPKNIMVNGQIKHWETLTGALENFVRCHHLQGLPCALSLPTHLAMMQKIKLPMGLSEADIFIEINTHLKRKFAWLNEPLAMDFTALSTDSETDVDIHYTAVREAHLLPYCEAIANCHLKLKIIDIDIYALKRVIQQFAPIPLTGNYAAIYFDRDHLTATYIIFNQTEVLTLDNWDCANTQELNVLMRKCITQTDFSFHAVKHLFVCGDLEVRRSAMSSSDPAMTEAISCLHWEQQLTFSAIKLKTQFAQVANRYLLACGMALREVPLW